MEGGEFIRCPWAAEAQQGRRVPAYAPLPPGQSRACLTPEPSPAPHTPGWPSGPPPHPCPGTAGLGLTTWQLPSVLTLVCCVERTEIKCSEGKSTKPSLIPNHGCSHAGTYPTPRALAIPGVPSFRGVLFWLPELRHIPAPLWPPSPHLQNTALDQIPELSNRGA